MRCVWLSADGRQKKLYLEKFQRVHLSDLERITKMAYSIVTIYGMNPSRLETCPSMIRKQSEYSFQKPYSEATAEKIDQRSKKYN